MMKFFLLLASLSGPPALAQAPVSDTPPAPVVSAKSYLLVDYQSRQVLAARNPDMRAEPASLTKLMTAYVVFDALRQKRITLEQPFITSDKAGRAPGARMFLTEGESVSVETLLGGLIVQSGNDAAVTLAEGVAGSEDAFVDTMNREAVRLGLKDSNFVNATGLAHPRHYSTATDLAALSRALVEEFPQYLPMYKMREFQHNGITQYNRNRLLGRDPFVDGLKTGHTESAGFCMVATALRKDRRVIAVVLDAVSESTRAIDAQKLLNYGFEAFDTVKLYSAGQPIHALPVWKGNSETLPAGLPADYFVTLPKGFFQRLKPTVASMQPLMAPIRVGDRVGTLQLSFDGKPFDEKQLIALESVGMAGLLVRAWHGLRLLYRDFSAAVP